jgi:hypothetical protein
MSFLRYFLIVLKIFICIIHKYFSIDTINDFKTVIAVRVRGSERVS